ncbi:unnamed protein product, partial [Ectocarpus sp. 12 AP-2014]
RANTIKEPPTSKIVTPQQQCRVPCPNAIPNAAAPLSRTVPPRSNTCPHYARSNTQTHVAPGDELYKSRGTPSKARTHALTNGFHDFRQPYAFRLLDQHKITRAKKDQDSASSTSDLEEHTITPPSLFRRRKKGPGHHVRLAPTR